MHNWLLASQCILIKIINYHFFHMWYTSLIHALKWQSFHEHLMCTKTKTSISSSIIRFAKCVTKITHANRDNLYSSELCWIICHLSSSLLSPNIIKQNSSATNQEWHETCKMEIHKCCNGWLNENEIKLCRAAYCIIKTINNPWRSYMLLPLPGFSVSWFTGWLTHRSGWVGVQ